jgi:hypothetical protein
MSHFIFPRVSMEHASELIEDTKDVDVVHISRAADRRRAADETFAVLGLPKINDEALRTIRRDIRELASRYGYPETQRNRTKFDIEAAVYLHASLPAPRGELLRNEVWQYIASSLLPDIVCWRWRAPGEEPGPDRFLGGVRNTFGRLWRRADVLRDDRLNDPWILVRSLSEDNVAAIIERPKVARHRLLVREASRAFLLRRDLAEQLGVKSPVQTYLRQLMMRITRRGAHVAFATLAHDDLVNALAETADATLVAFKVKAVPEKPLVARSPGLAIARPPSDTCPSGLEREGNDENSVWNKMRGLLGAR